MYTKQHNLDMEILQLLVNNGFPINKQGTFLYKDVVVNIIQFLENSTEESEIIKLKEQLKKKCSQFYFDIARNDNDMGVATFHKCIEEATEIAKRNNPNKIKQLCKGKDLDYKDMALVLAEKILKNNEEKEKSLPKENKAIRRVLTMGNL